MNRLRNAAVIAALAFVITACLPTGKAPEMPAGAPVDAEVQAILIALRSPDAKVRRQALSRCFEKKHAALIEPFAKIAADDADQSNRWAAMHLLGGYPDSERAESTLLGALTREREEYVRAQAAKSLAYFGETAARRLLDAAEKRDEAVAVRLAAVDALGKTNNRFATDRLIDLAGANTGALHTELVRTLGKIGDPRAADFAKRELDTVLASLRGLGALEKSLPPAEYRYATFAEAGTPEFVAWKAKEDAYAAVQERGEQLAAPLLAALFTVGRTKAVDARSTVLDLFSLAIHRGARAQAATALASLGETTREVTEVLVKEATEEHPALRNGQRLNDIVGHVNLNDGKVDALHVGEVFRALVALDRPETLIDVLSRINLRNPSKLPRLSEPELYFAQLLLSMKSKAGRADARALVRNWADAAGAEAARIRVSGTGATWADQLEARQAALKKFAERLVD